jgi:hypothetical protein
MRVPAWAVFPTAGKLISSSFRHPNKSKAIVVDPQAHRVSVTVDEVNEQPQNTVPEPAHQA